MRFQTTSNLEINGWVGIEQNEFFVHEIRTSYGEEIAWVFAFNRHFLLHLIFPALLGLLITVIEIIYMLATPPEVHCSGSWWSNDNQKWMMTQIQGRICQILSAKVNWYIVIA
jgi:hypothetical protein